MTIKHQPFLRTKKNKENGKKRNTGVSHVRRVKRESRHMIAMNNPFPLRPTLPVNKTHQHAQDGIARRREGSVPHLSLRHLHCVLIVVVVLFFSFVFYFLSYSMS